MFLVNKIRGWSAWPLPITCIFTITTLLGRHCCHTPHGAEADPFWFQPRTVGFAFMTQWRRRCRGYAINPANWTATRSPVQAVQSEGCYIYSFHIADFPPCMLPWAGAFISGSLPCWPAFSIPGNPCVLKIFLVDISHIVSCCWLHTCQLFILRPKWPTKAFFLYYCYPVQPVRRIINENWPTWSMTSKPACATPPPFLGHKATSADGWHPLLGVAAVWSLYSLWTLSVWLLIVMAVLVALFLIPPFVEKRSETKTSSNCRGLPPRNPWARCPALALGLYFLLPPVLQRLISIEGRYLFRKCLIPQLEELLSSGDNCNLQDHPISTSVREITTPDKRTRSSGGFAFAPQIRVPIQKVPAFRYQFISTGGGLHFNSSTFWESLTQ